MAVKLYGIKIGTHKENQDVKSMRQEVMMLKKYPHPLVVKYIDSFRDQNENAYLVTELAEKFDLRKEMEFRFEHNEYSDSDA